MTDFRFRVRTEMEDEQIKVSVETHLDPVFTDERENARDDVLDRHRAALVSLTEWRFRDDTSHKCARCGDVHLPSHASDEAEGTK